MKHSSKKLLKRQLLVFLASLLLSILSFLGIGRETGLIDGKYLKRGSHGAGDRSYELQVSEAGENRSFPVSVNVSAVRYTRAEANAVFSEILNSIEGRITKEEDSLDAVTGDLHLMDSFPEYGVRASWDFYPERPQREPGEAPETTARADREYFRKYRNLIESDGTVHNEILAEGEQVEGYLSLILSTYIAPAEELPELSSEKRYRSEPWKIHLTVLPKRYTQEESFRKQLEALLLHSNEADPEKKLLVLPQELNGRQLRFSGKADYSYLIFPPLGLLLAVLLYFQQQSAGKEAKKQRESQLLLDYSELVSKLLVYLGAGLTLRNAFEAISTHYDELVSRGSHENRFLYDELRILRLQLHRNLPETEVYLSFSQRIGLRPYAKLISLLEQNRKNGSRSLTELLSLEMEDAFETRKNTARRLGEEAGTKLLLPLFLQLAIVMVLIIVPAMAALS